MASRLQRRFARLFEMRILFFVESTVQDVRHAIRGLRKKPGFTVLIVLSLALGVGVNTAIFAMAETVLFRPLPYPESDRLVVLTQESQTSIRAGLKVAPGVNFYAERDNLKSYEAIMGMGGSSITETRTRNGEPRYVAIGLAAASMCSLFRTQPRIGRCFSTQEEAEQAPVLLLSYTFWQDYFGGDSSVVGRTLRYRSDPSLEDPDQIYTVIGVMPERFRLYDGNHDAWTPIPPDGSFVSFGPVVGRLKPGVNIEQARAEARELQKRLLPDAHEAAGGRRIVVLPLLEQIGRTSSTGLWILMAAAGLVLLIACANIASLLLARGTATVREMAVREAIGAGRWRVCRQLFTESLLLAGVGGGIGFLSAGWMVDGIRAIAFARLPRMDELSVDWNVFTFAVAISILSATLFGLFPALRASRVDLASAMKRGGPSSLGGRGLQSVMSGLVVFQSAICVIAVMAAGLLANTVIRLNWLDLGLRPDHAATVSIRPPRVDRAIPFVEEVLERVANVPGIESAAVTNLLLPYDFIREESFRLQSMPAGTYRLHAVTSIASADYFRAMGTPIVRGRSFEKRDQLSTTPVAIVSESLARKYWSSGTALGQTLIIPRNGSERIYQIVGVAADVRNAGLRQQPRDHIYKAFTQQETHVFNTNLVVRTQGDPSEIAPALKQALRSIDKDQPFSGFTTLEARLAGMIDQQRFYMNVLGMFAILALTLTALGVGGLVSYAVSRRSREIALRMCFGATREGVLRLFGIQSLKLVFTGLILGAAGSFALTRYLGSLLYEVTPTDPLTFAVTGTILILVSIGAGLLGARRTTTIDPALVLHEE